MFLKDNQIFTEWYHYALLFLWLVMLSIGIKYFYLLESNFKPKPNFTKGVNYGKGFLSVSFFLGLSMFLVWMFKPAQISTQSEISWDYIEYLFYGIFIILLFINSLVSIKYYTPKSRIIRLIAISFLMILYFYSGMFGGLMIVATLVLFIVIYTLLKLKKILTIG